MSQSTPHPRARWTRDWTNTRAKPLRPGRAEGHRPGASGQSEGERQGRSHLNGDGGHQLLPYGRLSSCDRFPTFRSQNNTWAGFLLWWTTWDAAEITASPQSNWIRSRSAFFWCRRLHKYDFIEIVFFCLLLVPFKPGFKNPLHPI